MNTLTKVAPWALLLGPVVAVNSIAAVYMSDEQSVTSIFKDSKFTRNTFQLTDEEKKLVEETSGDKVRTPQFVLWTNTSKDCVFVDQVLGKHEFITYAVGVTQEGRVKGVEILEYRESYGHQIKNETWRKQFQSKSKDEPFKLDDDIKNISGATLSASHVTSGVKRILITYDIIKKRI